MTTCLTLSTLQKSLCPGPTSQKLTINSLPEELLLAIFTLVVFSPKRANRHHFRLSWVCRYWRQIIFKNSNFWTTLNFRSWVTYDFRFLDLFVRNSGSRSELILVAPYAFDEGKYALMWMVFHAFLQVQSRRVKALLVEGAVADSKDGAGTGKLIQGLSNLSFENLQTLSIIHSSGIPVNLLAGMPHLEAFQLTSDADSSLEDFLHLPRQLKKLSLSILDGFEVPDLLIHLKRLEYLFIHCGRESYDMRVHQKWIYLPHLTTFILNGICKLMEVLDAPALKYLEITAPTKPVMPVETRRNEYTLVETFDLSMFTHLYIGYDISEMFDPTYEVTVCENPVDGCIWATIGPADISCPIERHSVYGDNGIQLTQFLSSWSGVSSSEDEPESLIHIHIPDAYAFTEENILLSRKLIIRMTSLETLVLCLPDTPYPPSYSRDPLPDRLPPKEKYEFHLDEFFRDMAQFNINLSHLIIRIGLLKPADVETLPDCFGENLWSSTSCPLLERITFHAHGCQRDVNPHAFWKIWLDFLSLRQNAGRPLKHLRMIGCPYPESSETLSQLKEMSEITNILMEEPDDSAFRLLDMELTNESKWYPTHGTGIWK